MKRHLVRFFLLTTIIIPSCSLFSSPILPNMLFPSKSEDPHSKNPIVLDFNSAVTQTMGNSLNLKISENEVQAKQAEIRQAKLYPNPTFSYSLETSNRGWKDRDDYYTLNQLIEMGGKRQKLVNVATNEYYATLYGYEATKLERLYRLTVAFIETVAAQEFFQIAVEEQHNAEEFLKITKSKHEAGKVSLIETSKTNLTKALADFNLRQRRTAFETAKKNLALLWSASEQEFDYVIYPFSEVTSPIPLKDYLAKLCDQPEIVRASYTYEAAYHNLQLEKSQRIPDVTLSLGYANDEGSKGLVAGIAVPLPLWDQNQGNIQKARYELINTDHAKKKLYLALEIKLATAYAELMRSFQDVEEIKNNLLKTASQAFDLAMEGYREGKFDYMDVLEAKRSLFDIREKYIQTLVSYHTRRAEIDYLHSETN